MIFLVVRDEAFDAVEEAVGVYVDVSLTCGFGAPEFLVLSIMLHNSREHSTDNNSVTRVIELVYMKLVLISGDVV